MIQKVPGDIVNTAKDGVFPITVAEGRTTLIILGHPSPATGTANRLAYLMSGDAL